MQKKIDNCKSVLRKGKMKPKIKEIPRNRIYAKQQKLEYINDKVKYIFY